MPRDVMDTAPATSNDAARLLRVWLSPSFPVGGFAYSQGLEAAIAQGLVGSRDDLADWLAALIEMGSIRNDVILLAAVHGRVQPDMAVNALALALQPSAQRHLETAQQGTSFAATIAAAWPCADITALRAAGDGVIAYPVAVGVAARGYGIAVADTAHGFGLASVHNLVSAAIRLSVIGQTDGQRVIAALIPALDALAHIAPYLTLDDLGGACFSADLAALEHETLPTRMFRS